MKDDGDWEIVQNAEGSDMGSRADCKHCINHRTEHRKGTNGYEYDEKLWDIPRAVVAYNEGGYNCTVVCLDCILEVAA